MKKYAIILAAGKGKRTGINLPKQFYIINKKPLITHAIEKFLSIKNIKIILVIAKSKIDYWKKISKNNSFHSNILIVEGGKTRFNSVNNALEKIKGEGIVAIHDGVRPFITTKLINKLFNHAKKNNNAVPHLILKDSIRKVNKSMNHHVNRKDYVLIQTPQVFNISEIKKAYKKNSLNTANKFTDDASIYETLNKKINLIKGEELNFKITSKNDLKIAEYYLS